MVCMRSDTSHKPNQARLECRGSTRAFQYSLVRQRLHRIHIHR